MTRIGLFSDFHAHRPEHEHDINALIGHVNATTDVDLLVCAGDISHRTAEIERFLGAITLACPRCWVPGNHDVWAAIDPDSGADCAEQRYRELFPRLSRRAGWSYLPEEPLLVPEHKLAVVGSVGWFSGDAYSEWRDCPATEEDDRLASTFASDLEAQILSVPDNVRIVVVTHHVTNPQLLSQFPGLGSSSTIQTLLRHAPRLVLCIHGHLHQRYDPCVVQGIRFVAHPFGYPCQHARVADGFRVVEVE